MEKKTTEIFIPEDSNKEEELEIEKSFKPAVPGKTLGQNQTIKKDRRKSNNVKKQIIVIDDQPKIEPMNVKRVIEIIDNSEEVIRKHVLQNSAIVPINQPEMKIRIENNEKMQHGKNYM